MRQLEEALLLLADRAEPLTNEVLLNRIETRLAVEGTRPVVADREDPTMKTHHALDLEPTTRVEPPPTWRGPLIAVATAAIVVAAVLGVAFASGLFGGDTEADVAATVDSPPTSATTVEEPIVEEPATTPPPTSLELADQYWAAFAGSDPSAWTAFLPLDAPAYAEIDWFWLEDFDGDGTITLADWQQFQIALHGVGEYRMERQCDTVPTDTVRCVLTISDAFFELGGALLPPSTILLTFEAGLVTAEEREEAADPELWDEAWGEAMEGRDRAWTEYEDWVAATYPDRYSTVFDGPVEEQMVDFVVLPAAIPEHEQLLAEYLETVRGTNASG